MNGTRIGTLVVLGLLAIVGLSVIGGSFYTVDQGNIGVLTRNGAVVGEAKPGLGWKVPFIDDVTEMSVRSTRYNVDKASTYSKDVQSADLAFQVIYRLDPAKVLDIYSTIGTGYEGRVLGPAVFNTVKVVFGQFTAIDVVGQRARLVQTVTEALRNDLSHRGIVVEDFQLSNVDFSNEYEKSIEERMKAEVEVSRLKQNLERERVQADIVRTQALAQADQVRLAAQAEADRIKAVGDAQAGAITARGKALAENINLIDLTKAERWNGVLPTTMLPGSSVPFINVK